MTTSARFYGHCRRFIKRADVVIGPYKSLIGNGKELIRRAPAIPISTL